MTDYRPPVSGWHRRNRPVLHTGHNRCRIRVDYHLDPGADRGLGRCRLHFCAQDDPECDDDTETLSAEHLPGLAGRALLYEGRFALRQRPAGIPGRKLTDGPADTEPAPSPDLAHVAYIHKANPSDYGGELWVLDLSPAHALVGAPRRLVDPAALPPRISAARNRQIGPRRSCTRAGPPPESRSPSLRLGKVVASLSSLTPTAVRPYRTNSECSPTTGTRGRPTANTSSGRADAATCPPSTSTCCAVGATSTPVVKDTDAFSVTYDTGGQAILFTNGDASGEAFAEIPFALRDGGIYSVATPGGAPANPPARPTSLIKAHASYGDVAALVSGAVAFTETSADGSSKTIQVLDAQSSLPSTKIANVAADSPGPAWGPGNIVAYLDTSPGKHLIVTDADNRTPKQIDTGVDAFAWPPQMNSTTSHSTAPR